ncbi:MAG: DUF72 domain-containing protein [Thermoprotei archaeon]|nr:MAG: DUF72 domain-containing protein [Thermoprotei archaeon]
MKELKIGCCGFPVSRKRYFSEFSVVELQNTFYDLPRIDWCKKIRSEAPEEFEFTIKAWQVITHPATSPTWRKIRGKIQGDKTKYGYLKPTRENLTALEKVFEVANALKTRIIVLQTPASMPYSEESIRWINEFFENAVSMAPKNLVIAWEPRGIWAEQTTTLKQLLEKWNILHITDLFKRKPVHMPKGLLYTRLHGIGKKEINYKYKYTVADFEKLGKILSEPSFNTGYVMFNNVYMYQDAKFLKSLLASYKGFTVT